MKERSVIKERIDLFGDGRYGNYVIPAEGELPPGERQLKCAHTTHGRWGVILLGVMRVIALTVAFAAIFYTFFDVGPGKGAESVKAGADAQSYGNTGQQRVVTAPGLQSDSGCIGENIAGVTPESSGTDTALPDTDIEFKAPGMYYVLDQAGAGLVSEFSEKLPAYTLAPLFRKGKTGVIIIHTHGSEYCSAGSGVAEFGDKLTEILERAGIGCFHCEAEHGSDSLIGAYGRMQLTLSKLLGVYPSTALIIDLHSSDTSSALTLTVGVGDNGDNGWWHENLLLARAVCEATSKVQPTLRLLSGDLGQNSGVLTLTAGIGSADTSPEVADEILITLARALINLAVADS